MFNQGMLPLVQIGNVSRGSYFSASVVQQRAFSMGASRLGQTGMEWYDRARTGVQTFESLLAQVEALPPTQKAEVMAWLGAAADQASPRYRYLSVVDDIRTVEASDPLDYAVYDVGRRQDRVKKLEEFNKAFPGRIQLARRSAPGVTPTRGTMPAAPAAATDYTLPLVIGGGAAAVLLAILLAS